MATKIQLRRDTAANWTSNDPTLSAGEWGYETDTTKLKIGDGSSAWTALGYTFIPAATNANTFTIDADSVSGKIIVDVALNAGENHSMTITNAVMTENVVITLPATTGTVALTSLSGTTASQFTVDSDTTSGKIAILAASGAADKTLTLTNTPLTDDRTVTFQNVSGTVAYTDLTGTTASSFTVDSDSTTGKLTFTAASGASGVTMTFTNAALTDNRTITFPNSTGTVMLVPVAQTELTDELTTITCNAPSTGDYAIADPVTGGYGFTTVDEGLSLFKVVANCQTRINELETKLTALGFLADAD